MSPLAFTVLFGLSVAVTSIVWIYLVTILYREFGQNISMSREEDLT